MKKETFWKETYRETTYRDTTENIQRESSKHPDTQLGAFGQGADPTRSRAAYPPPRLAVKLFSRKSAKAQGSPLVGGPLVLRPYWSREGAVNLGTGFVFDKNSVF